MTDKVAELLMESFSSVYCDTCRNNDSSECDYCHRKAMSWAISEEAAYKIARDIQEIYGS